MTKPLPDAQRVLESYIEYGTVAAVCRHWSITRTEFKKVLRAIGLATTPRKVRKRRCDAGTKGKVYRLSESRKANRDLIRGYFLGGMNGSEIGRKIGRSRQAVNQMIRKLGLTEKDRGSLLDGFFATVFDATAKTIADASVESLITGEPVAVDLSQTQGAFITDWKESNA